VLLVIVGAGASFDSVPSRPIGASGNIEKYRLPLADQLFESREMFQAVQRDIPQVMQVSGSLLLRTSGESVEDVLQRYASQIPNYPVRETQLAAVRFYIQGIISQCEAWWYRADNQVATNLMTLIDQIELARGHRDRPVFVTFNYDRLIENALENRGRTFGGMPDYIRSDSIPVIKLHGSVDWARRIERLDISRFGGSPWQIAVQISNEIHNLPKPGIIERYSATLPSSHIDQHIAIPAIAIPLKDKSDFECPDDHKDLLRSIIPKVTTMLTIGWRGAEQHFLGLLRESGLGRVNGICVAGGPGQAEETVANLSRFAIKGSITPYNEGFTTFVAKREIERLLNITWSD
jgi:SIR2-like protein